MRRVMLLALLALALPMALSADQIRFDTGTTSDLAAATSSFTSNFTNPFSADVSCPDCDTVPGTTKAEISLTTDSLAPCDTKGACDFTSGTVTVMQNGSTLFTSAVQDGTLIRGTDTVVINADLVPSAQITSSEANFGFTFNADGVITNANASVTQNTAATVIPEPGTLGMLATGLIGLAGTVRRKLKPATEDRS